MTSAEKVCEACGKAIPEYSLFYVIPRGDWDKWKDQFISLHPYHFLVTDFISR